MVNGTAQAVRVGGDRLRRVQAGRVPGYVTSFVLGVVMVAAVVVLAVAVR
jgi:hypothetical protein